MGMTPENANTWRDLAEQLTAEQIIEIEDSERGYRYRATMPAPHWSTTDPRSDEEIEDLMLHQARGYARENLTAAIVGPVPAPPGTDWDDDIDPLSRCVYADRAVAGTKVKISAAAIQFADGGIERVDQAPIATIIEGGTDICLTAAQLRELAGVALDLADQLDRWTR
jgi:hypothetical protein